MNIDGIPTRTIWPTDGTVEIIDQTRLPHEFVVHRLASLEDAAEAIRVMRVRGAPLIGATAAYGLALAASRDTGNAALRDAGDTLIATRPTAVNLQWAVRRVLEKLLPLAVPQRAAAAWAEAAAICAEDVAQNQAIGRHGGDLIQAIANRKPGPVNLLT
ncbi:MAG: S-methyl-5-thioribose-1-phosphate isomerase, partial [Gammaproteobacteria bacterium]|nr:S-methyl-5-thioribose-1-phosphate isomerase [Gammaproteobacteria bacterium]